MSKDNKQPPKGPSRPSIPASDSPGNVPVLPLGGVVVFPLMIAHISLGEEAAKLLAEEAWKGERILALFHPLPPPPGAAPEPEGAESTLPPERLSAVGTLCTILRILRTPDGSVRLLLHGLSRVRLAEATMLKPYLRANLETVTEREAPRGDEEVDRFVKLTMEGLQRAVTLSAMPEEILLAAMNVEGPGRLADLVASNLPVKSQDLIPLLCDEDQKQRLGRLQRLLARELQVLELGNRINEEVREEVDKGQRAFFLNQQIKALRRELGEIDSHESEVEELQNRIRNSRMPDHARRVAEKELGRLQGLPTAAAEYGVIRTYLEWILDVPWATSTDDHIDLQRAREILDEDHFGLEKVKERILEYLAVIRLKKGDLKGPILCLVGPPGVGKTSLGRSVARATGRKFQNFSLGGIRDEAEIRGHRRTYVGAMPGRIIKALKDSATNNPLIMLDEIDKLGSDFRGDPGAALLEVLDPEQNNHFTDHYMDMPVDLSRVMFITTANTVDSIPEPLRDRMEILRIAGYTDLEKFEIARRYLIPRETENAGLRAANLTFQKAAIERLVHDYTSEAGVRNLQREVAKVCRKVAFRVAEYDSAVERAARTPASTGKKAAKGKAPAQPSAEIPPAPPRRLTVRADMLEDFLGPKRSYQEVAERLERPGVAVGLAWTSVGGAIMFIEAARYPGKGDLKLTGQLGDVMKESAQAALTYLRANTKTFGLQPEDFREWDYHVHVPAGATPKDGPSAGVAVATSLASLIKGVPVKNFVAMTGEITLRGNAMPVGGIKEKVLAAHRAGIRQVFLPHHNECDYVDVPTVVAKEIKVSYFRSVAEYIHAALRK